MSIETFLTIMAAVGTVMIGVGLLGEALMPNATWGQALKILFGVFFLVASIGVLIAGLT